MKLQFTHIKILAQHEEGAKHVLQNTQYSFKNLRSIHGNDEIILCWSQLKLRITFQLQFLDWNIFFLFYLWFWQKIDIKTKKKKEIISTLFYVIKSLELLISV